VTNSCVPVNLEPMIREVSSGGVVLRHTTEGWQIAVIEPRKDADAPASAKSAKQSPQKMLLALPKGLVDPGENPQETATREVLEETGITAGAIAKLGDTKYVYVRSWGDQERVFKIVSFYLFRYESGTIDEIAPEMRIEVKRALWIALEDAAKKLAYRGERDMVRRAEVYLKAHPEF
jgi:8-oxo-dGTP pyrophosphatase MutT (NUDIX family)